MGASGFLNQFSNQLIATFGAIQSIPLLWVWLKVMATDPWAHGSPAGHRMAPRSRPGDRTGRAVGAQSRRQPADPGARPPRSRWQSRGGRGRTPKHAPSKAKPSRRTAAASLRSRCFVACRWFWRRLFLELLPVLGFLTVTHLLAATPLGGRRLPSLVLLAVIDAYALCSALLCVARMMFSPKERASAPARNWRRDCQLRHALDRAASCWSSVFGYAIGRGRAAAGHVRLGA